MATLIADCGATKCVWNLLDNGKVKKISTPGFSLYFMSKESIEQLLKKELLSKIKNTKISAVFFYGTGIGNPANALQMKQLLKQLFVGALIEVNTDLLAAARALCGNTKGIVCILGTGSNSGFYDGKKIIKTNPSLGYVLGDEGSGAFLGKKVLQYYLYKTFDDELTISFNKTYNTDKATILNSIYKSPSPNKYIAGFANFLSENRGHYMIENIIEDGINDFFLNHIYKYRESWLHPIHFNGGIAYAFKDVIKELCHSYELEVGNFYKNPMQGLIHFHQ